MLGVRSVNEVILGLCWIRLCRGIAALPSVANIYGVPSDGAIHLMLRHLLQPLARADHVAFSQDEHLAMKRMASSIILLLLANQGASAATTMGNGALALASIVTEYSSLLTGNEKRVMVRLFDGSLNFTLPPNTKITVQAGAIICRASNVDITSRSCNLTFGNTTIALKRRKAHELFATLAEMGVPSEGAAGTIFEGLSHLLCTVDPREIQQNSGGGADCKFDAAAP